MATPFLAASLVASPSYPNAVAWSDENLVAVASGNLVTILNPAMPFGARGLITISASNPFSFGLIERKDLNSGSMLPICLTHDVRPGVRSISWSPIGLSPNYGCLLAVCTTEGRVKLYRLPFSEFSAEWVEVMDISEQLYTYITNIGYRELSVPLSEHVDGQASKSVTKHRNDDDDLTLAAYQKNSKRRKTTNAIIEDAQKTTTLCTELEDYPLLLVREGSEVEVCIMDGYQLVWVSGKVHQVRQGKALVFFRETGEEDKWVELQSNNTCSGLADKSNSFPEIRPVMDAGYFPNQISLRNCNQVEKILMTGAKVEAWINQRWIEGTLMAINDSTLQVKLNGVKRSVMVDNCDVRLAPRWIDKEKVWQVTIIKIKTEGQVSFKTASLKPCTLKENNQLQMISMPKSDSKLKSKKQTSQNGTNSYISPDEYASRSAMLSSLILAWSPVIPSTKSSNCCSVLAVGGKSGHISFWKVSSKYYSIMHSEDPTSAVLIGLLQAHNSFVTAINWLIYDFDPLNPQFIITTASSDGSVKIWRLFSVDLVNSSEENHASFSLLKEVSSAGSVPVSVLSAVLPAKSVHQMLLAVGKTSGSLEVWTCDILTWKLDKVGVYDAHNHIVTGLSWAFNGKCLYSCSQDNSMHSWIFHEDSLHKVAMPSNTTGVKSSTDVPNVCDSCYGLALSPGNLAVAVACRFDAFLLNPMYQARSQKAAVEFFWIGGQKLDILSNKNPEFRVKAYEGFDHDELANWEMNITWSLTQYKNPIKPLVIWDIIEALSSFNNALPKYTNKILSKWLNSYIGKETPQISKLANLSSRQLHLINIVGRRLVLEEAKKENINSENTGECIFEEEERMFWREILENSENELRQRVVGFSFGALSNLASLFASDIIELRYWVPVGLGQMEQWVAKNREVMKDPLLQLASKIKKLDKSKLGSVIKYKPKEQCSLCSSKIEFESPEEAFCRATSCNGGTGQSHRLNRCSVSMQLTPITPSWFCVCCRRYATKFVPNIFLTTPTCPKDFTLNPESTPLEVSLKPFCPFCGILLQRLQPVFLLSPSPM